MKRKQSNALKGKLRMGIILRRIAKRLRIYGRIKKPITVKRESRIKITLQEIIKRLRDYDRIKERLRDEVMQIQRLKTYSPNDMLDEMVLHSDWPRSRIRSTKVSDPTSHVALVYHDAYKKRLRTDIQPFIRMHNEEQRLMNALDACMKRLNAREQALIRQTYIEKKPLTSVAARAHLSVTAFCKERAAALTHLTALIRAQLADAKAS